MLFVNFFIVIYDGLKTAYMISYDREFNSVTRIEIVTVALNFRHVKEEFFSFLNLIVEKSKLSFDRINNSSFLLAHGSHLIKN